LFSLLFSLLPFLDARDLHPIHGALGGIGGHGLLAVHHLPNHLVVGKFFDHLARTHAQRAEGREARFERGVRDLLWLKLLINPCINAHSHDLLDIAGARAKGKAIERMHRALLFVQAGSNSLLLLFREQMRNRAGEA